MHLRISPISSDSVPPKSDKTVTQSITIENPNQVSGINKKSRVLY